MLNATEEGDWIIVRDENGKMIIRAKIPEGQERPISPESLGAFCAKLESARNKG